MGIGSLFSGIGGLELGLEWAGLGPVAWQVEQNEWCRQVLAKHWPDAGQQVEDSHSTRGSRRASQATSRSDASDSKRSGTQLSRKSRTQSG